jgi:hypothetical protein
MLGLLVGELLIVRLIAHAKRQDQGGNGEIHGKLILQAHEGIHK